MTRSRALFKHFTVGPRDGVVSVSTYRPSAPYRTPYLTYKASPRLAADPSQDRASYSRRPSVSRGLKWPWTHGRPSLKRPPEENVTARRRRKTRLIFYGSPSCYDPQKRAIITLSSPRGGGGRTGYGAGGQRPRTTVVMEFYYVRVNIVVLSFRVTQRSAPHRRRCISRLVLNRITVLSCRYKYAPVQYFTGTRQESGARSEQNEKQKKICKEEKTAAYT